jgi:hypothetical protein
MGIDCHLIVALVHHGSTILGIHVSGRLLVPVDGYFPSIAEDEGGPRCLKVKSQVAGASW